MKTITVRKPATPLPWRTGDMYRTVFGPPNGNPAPQIVTLSGGPRRDDTAYIVRTANAYPQLVEALRELAYRCDGEEGVRADGSNIQTMRAHGLLRELGEE